MASKSSSEASSPTSTPAPHHMSTDDAGTDGSQTSHSPSVASISHSKPSHRESGLSSEAHAFLSDLSNYLALGCLKYRDVADNITLGLGDDGARWQNLPLAAPGFPPESNLMKLTAAAWTRVQIGQSTRDSRYTIYRVYILPGDVGLRFFDRENRRLLAALESLVATIDVSSETWSGRYSEGVEVGFDNWATSDEGSLFYMFNKLPSPRPDPTLVKEKYAREAVEDLLDVSALIGLKTPLYPYQRRSAALMLQRESVSTLILDPRLESRTAPDGSSFYFGPRELLFHRNPRYYEASRGGILAETMGLGKTLICLSLILATRHHLPKVPVAYGLPLVRSECASLADMSISAINRKSVPWKIEFERIKHRNGDDMSVCAQKLESIPPEYEIPVEPARWNRKTVIPPPQKKTLASTTILVVPRNLCKQWHSEIQKHVDESVLRILLMEEPKSVLPAADELRGHDVIIFSRSRFEMEVKDGADDRGRRLLSRPPLCTCPYIGATRTVDCHCLKADDIYESPLKQLHFKRLIIDEGHFFSSSNNTAVLVAKKLVTADHRWVVSGTPAKDLLGVEADMSVAQNAVQEEAGESRDEVLDRRRYFNPKEDTSGAIKSLGMLASHFLCIRPWAAEGSGERPAVWEEHIYRHEAHRRRTFTGFSSCLRRTLEAMVVKTQPEDVEQDINLPPLSHEVIRLEPSYYDKLTANLFSIVLTANAVTSERKDADYLFHKNSAQARYQLISNLRQSAFFWTGFSEEDIIASQKNSRGYLEKPNTACTDDDRRLLTEALQAADSIMSSAGWKAQSRCHELGVAVDGWPQESAEFWAFGGSSTPMLTGISQLLEAQKHVNERIGLEDPGEGLAGIGVRAMKRAEEGRREDQVVRKESKPTLLKTGISLSGEPTLKRRASSSGKSEKSTAKRAKTSRDGKEDTPVAASNEDDPGANGGEDRPTRTDTTATAPGQPSERRWSDVERSELSVDSPFSQGRIIGTTSAKLTYLTSQILKYYEEEKILVFYEGDNIAYYIAQMLELLHIKHEIYAKSLAAALKSEYVVRFNEEPQDRVLLMDVKHAAHGLNISSASRIYFVNPVCRPDIEAQAIKRAHRIGQTRQQVFVQTLLLKGTIEEKMHERAKRMTSVEHHVSHLEDDDGMREIIQGAGLMSVMEHERSGSGQMASLEVPQRLWARSGWRDFSSAKLPRAHANAAPDAAQTVPSRKRKGKEREKRKTKSVQLATPSPPPPPVHATSPIVSIPRQDSTQQFATSTETAIAAASGSASKGQADDDDDDKPMMGRWRLLPQSPRRF
jgi:hypothetical protein